MNNTDSQTLPPDMTRKIMEEARRRGLRLSDLTPAQYRSLALSIRSVGQKIEAVATAVESLAATTSGARRVALPIYEARKAMCKTNKCGSFGTLANLIPVCHACNCSDKFLESKWHDPHQFCPKNLWTRHVEEK